MVYYVNEGSVYALGIIFPVLCTTVVALRFWARKRNNLSYGADDWVAAVALLFTIALGAMLILGDAMHEFGWHSKPPGSGGNFAQETKRIEELPKLEFSFYALSIPALGFVRLTFALLYRRIFCHGAAKSLMRIAIWTLIVLIICWTITFLLLNLFQCAPHLGAYFETQETFEKYCSKNFKILASGSISDVILDVALLLLPLEPVLGLHMKARKKVLILGVFALGIFSVAAGVTRMVLSIQIMNYDYGSSERIFGLAGTSDAIGVVSVAVWWAYMEIGIGCLVSNLPTLVGLFRSTFKNPLASLMARVSLSSLKSNRSARRADAKDNAEEYEAFRMEHVHHPIRSKSGEQSLSSVA